MDKPVLVLVMSEACGACQNFKRKILSDLEKDLRNDSRVRFVVLEFPTMAIPQNKDGREYHPELRNGFVEFFPTFLLFPGNLWNNKDSKLKGVAKHSLKKNSQVDYSKSSILSWIDETLRKDSLFFSSNIVLTENGKPLYSKEGYYTVPTYGTYNRFRPTKTDDDF